MTQLRGLCLEQDEGSTGISRPHLRNHAGNTYRSPLNLTQRRTVRINPACCQQNRLRHQHQRDKAQMRYRLRSRTPHPHTHKHNVRPGRTPHPPRPRRLHPRISRAFCHTSADTFGKIKRPNRNRQSHNAQHCGHLNRLKSAAQ